MQRNRYLLKKMQSLNLSKCKTNSEVCELVSARMNEIKYEDMLEKVSEIKEVDSMQSMVILSTFKDSTVLPLPA